MIVTYLDTQRVTINGITEPRVYRARAFGDNKVILHQVYSYREYGDPELFSNISVDGVTYGTQAETINALNAAIYAGNSDLDVTLNNPLPCIDVDNNNRVSLNTVFGDKVVATRIPQLAAQFQYPLAADQVNAPESVNGGTVVQENALLKLRTDSQLGSAISLQSKDTIRYIPGYQCFAIVTPDFNAPVSGQSQLVGVFDTETGFGFGYDTDQNFVFMHRRDGVDTYFNIDLNLFFNRYGYNLNPQKGNIYYITYGHLGYAPAKLEVIPPQGGLCRLYEFEYPNTSDQTHLSQTFLPLRAELNNGTGSTAMELTIGSVLAGIVDGGGESEYTFARDFNWYTPNDLVVSGNTEIVGFKNKDTFGGITNYVKARLFNFNASVNLNKNSIIAVIKNPTVLNTPTWVDVNTDSVLQYSTDIQIDFTSFETYFTRPLFNTDSFDKDVEKFIYDLFPGGIAVFAILTTGAGDARFSNFWKELF